MPSLLQYPAPAAHRPSAAAARIEAPSERRIWWVAGGISILYWVSTLVLSMRKLMWNDELYTYYIASLPTMNHVWQALLAGGEQTPPFFYFVTRASFALFGVNNISIRLPEIVGFWAMSIGLFVFVARRGSKWQAVTAAVIPFVSGAIYYANDGRPYGLLLGFSTLALLSWQSITLGRARIPWLIALTVSAAAAVCTHYYGVLSLLPIAIGETVSIAQRRRRVDPFVWVALGVAAVQLIWHMPLLRIGGAYAGAFWSPPQWVNIPDFYYNLLSPAIVPLTFVIVAAAAVKLFWREGWPPDQIAAPQWPEIAAAVSFVALPIVCVVLAKSATGAFTNRYAISAVIGVALLAPLVAQLLAPLAGWTHVIAVAVFTTWFAFTTTRELIDPTQNSLPVDPTSIRAAVRVIESAPERDVKVAIADPHTFTVLSHYAPELRSRLVYLADPELALRRLGHNSVERGMVDLIGPWFGMNVRDFTGFIDTEPRFLLYGNFGTLAFLNWSLAEIEERQLHTEFRGAVGENLFLFVSRQP